MKRILCMVISCSQRRGIQTIDVQQQRVQSGNSAGSTVCINDGDIVHHGDQHGNEGVEAADLNGNRIRKNAGQPPSQGMTSGILARKNADKIRQRTLLPSSQRESATVYQRSLTVQFSCPRATRLSPFVHDLPSQKLPPNGGITQQLSPLRPFPCAHSAVRRGFLTQIPFRLLPDLLHKKDLYDQHSHTVSPDHIYLSVANE